MSVYQSISEMPKGNFEIPEELISLLKLLETCNPCDQAYETGEDCMVVSYFLRLNLLNFLRGLRLPVRVQIIGLPLSLSEKGYWGEEASVEKLMEKRKGLKLLLNGNPGFQRGGRTLSTFVLDNRFADFEEYLNALRSPYRRRVIKALGKRKNLVIRGFEQQEFSEKHYSLYLSIMARTENPLEVLPLEFFRECEGSLIEFVVKGTNRLVGFVQLKMINHRLCFLFGGFEKEDNEEFDLYFNMLLTILETGIEQKVKTIEFGQTAEESKLKLGCREVAKHLVVHHSNPGLNWMIQKLLPFLTYTPYPVTHHVFKENPLGDPGGKNDCISG